MITISIKSITDIIYAESAMRHILSESRPAMLDRDREKSLRLMLRGSFARLCLSLIPFIKGSNLAGSDSELITIDLALPADREDADRHSVFATIERALASHVLHECYRSVDAKLSQAYLDEFMELTQKIRAVCGSNGKMAVRPAWY